MYKGNDYFKDEKMELTALYYTANQIPEFFAKKIRENLFEACRELPIISISQKPLDFGKNICIGERGPSILGIYNQVLIGAREAKTKYVALCEDDILYHSSHFRMYRPSEDHFGYNHNKWEIFTWERNPVFSCKIGRSLLNQCIANRQLLIEALEERFSKFSTYTKERIRKHFGEFGKYERWLGVTIRKQEIFFSPEPNIIFCHGDALDYKQGLGSRKGHGDIRIKEVPPWGKAEEILIKYFGEENWKNQQRRNGYGSSGHTYENLYRKENKL